MSRALADVVRFTAYVSIEFSQILMRRFIVHAQRRMMMPSPRVILESLLMANPHADEGTLRELFCEEVKNSNDGCQGIVSQRWFKDHIAAYHPLPLRQQADVG